MYFVRYPFPISCHPESERKRATVCSPIYKLSLEMASVANFFSNITNQSLVDNSTPVVMIETSKKKQYSQELSTNIITSTLRDTLGYALHNTRRTVICIILQLQSNKFVNDPRNSNINYEIGCSLFVTFQWPQSIDTSQYSTFTLLCAYSLSVIDKYTLSLQ